MNSYTSSNTTNIDAIHTSTGSFKSFTSSFDTAFGMSGADVTVKGNLTVSGTQTTVNSTTVAIGDNIIQLNGTGATNAGLVVRDATAPNTVSGSFLWDSTNDKWIAGALGSEDDVVLKTANQTLTNKTINASQLVDASVTNAKLQYSSLTIAGTSVSLNGSISAATILSGTGTVSGSSQISYTGLSNIPTGIVSGSSQITYGSISGTPSGIVSGSVQIDLTATTNYSTGIKTRLNSEGVLSGSAQVVAALPSGTVSGSSQILAGTTIHSGAFFNGISVVSGSAQISFGGITGVPSGLVSGSSQVTGIGNAQLTNSSFNIGTTSISLGRASASQTLTGVSIDGNAGTVTNGVYTTGDQTIGGAKTFSSRVSVNGTLAVNTSNDSSTSTGGITFWDAGNTTTSWVGFKNATNSGWGTHGGASATYHTYFVMDTVNRGWIFRYASPGGTDFSGTNVASISNTGRFAANNGYQFTFNGTNRGGIYAKTTWFGSGSDYSPSMCVEGGLNFNVYVDGSTTKGTTIDTSGHLYPVGNGTQNLGGSSNRWATVFTSDLSLNNGIGDYTIVEGEEKLYLYNNKNNKVYSFVLQEEDPATATPKKS